MVLADLYWLAGWLEGEGCFTVFMKQGTPAISAACTDRDIIQRVSLLWNSNVYSRKRAENRKEIFQTTITSRKAAAWMMTLYPLMGQRRQARIRECLQVWKNDVFAGKPWRYLVLAKESVSPVVG